VRFAIEAAAIILAAALAGALHLPWWQIGAVVLVVLVLAVLAESWLSRPARSKRAAAPPAELAGRAHLRVLEYTEPLELEAGTQPEPRPEPVVVAPPPEAQPEPVAAAAPWNVLQLERALRDSGDDNQERAFLLQYLRDYADADGNLPAHFDDLVRESFGQVLAP
jgi:hypothetical protein